MKWIEGNNIHLLAPPLKKENVAKVYFMLHYQFIFAYKNDNDSAIHLGKIFFWFCVDEELHLNQELPNTQALQAKWQDDLPNWM